LLHIERLDLPDDKAYQVWCKQNGLSDSLNKSDAQRKKELALFDRVQSESVLARRSQEKRRPEDTIRAIYEGRIDVSQLRQPFLEKIASVFGRLDDAEERKAYLKILLHVERTGDLFGMKPAVSVLGAAEGNTFVEAMGQVAAQYREWLRDLDDWKPDSHNSRRQFGALLRHLLCQYNVPSFMDVAWFGGADETVVARQDWFIHVGAGGNIRRADIPLQLTKKMAHLFLEAPGNYTVDEAFRWGQILGLGGETPLVRAVNGTFLGYGFAHEIFWSGVIHFFVNNPMLDPDQVGPIVDYIQNQKFAPQEIVEPGGTVRVADPAQPNFAIKGRTVDKLLRQVEAWHTQLARETRMPQNTWKPSEIVGPYEWESDASEKWTVSELLSTRELSQEGRAMHHCVGSYAGNCRSGRISVWSMQVQDEEGDTHRVMTIAISGSKRITQARGRFNALPSGKTPNGKRKALERKYQGYLAQSRKVLRDWREQEGLTMSARV
jgi:hypothetical protein